MNLVLSEEIKAGVRTLTLNDPTLLNAMSEPMAEEFAEQVRALLSMHSLRAVILKGAGSAFSSGGHLEMLFEKTKLGREENRRRMLQFYSNFLSLRKLRVPVIAEINGHAVGAGACLALVCDFRIAADSAKLGFPFLRLGLHPGMGVTHYLPKLVGSAKAQELLFRSNVFSAEKAGEMGLVHEVHRPEALRTRSLQLLDEMFAAGPQAFRNLKQSLREPEEDALRVALEREADMQAESYASEEFREGISAAREKREAKFGSI